MSNTALRSLLWTLGQCLTQGSRFVPSVRAQITRTMTFQISAGDRVARHWVFDSQLRRAVSQVGRADAPECSVHFRSSRQALAALLSPRAVDRIVAGLHDGSVQLHGSAFVVLWFYGLTRKFVKLGRSEPRNRVPAPYTAHDPAACGVETIVIEPAVIRLDPGWAAAWKARSTLSMIRAASDEQMLEP